MKPGVFRLALPLIVPLVLAVTLGASERTVSAEAVGRQFVYTVKAGDSLTAISSRFGVSLSTLIRDNGFQADRKLTIGEEVRVDSRHLAPAGQDGIVINVPQRMLFLFANGRIVRAYPVALGQPDWPTVVGEFSVVRKEVDPVWDVPASIQEEMRRQGKPVLTCVPPGPANPLGKFYLALSVPNFGIHGTNAPSSIFRFQTHGCIRVHPEDIEDLFPRIAVGTPVEIVYQDILLGELEDGSIVIEVHRDIYRRLGNALARAREMAAAAGLTERLNWKAIEQAVRRADGTLQPVGR